MTRSSLFAWALLVLATAMWGGVWFLVANLGSERVAYADALTQSHQQDIRGETATRAHLTVQATEVERAALASLVNVSIVQAVDAMEKAGRDAGASNVAVSEATPISGSPDGLAQYSITINANGSFSAIMRTISLFETLPFPASLEQFDIAHNDKQWHVTAHLRVVLAATP